MVFYFSSNWPTDSNFTLILYNIEEPLLILWTDWTWLIERDWLREDRNVRAAITSLLDEKRTISWKPWVDVSVVAVVTCGWEVWTVFWVTTTWGVTVLIWLADPELELEDVDWLLELEVVVEVDVLTDGAAVEVEVTVLVEVFDGTAVDRTDVKAPLAAPPTDCTPPEVVCWDCILFWVVSVVMTVFMAVMFPWRILAWK